LNFILKLIPKKFLKLSFVKIANEQSSFKIIVAVLLFASERRANSPNEVP
jgi:hypothetical protein